MIRPSKHMTLETCLIGIASVVIQELLKSGVSTIPELEKVIAERLKITEFNLGPPIGFLFALGKVEYFEASDSVKLRTCNQP
ncbi:MAG: ABC-three component system middle component 8 [Pseudomonadota bacterium]